MILERIGQNSPAVSEFVNNVCCQHPRVFQFGYARSLAAEQVLAVGRVVPTKFQPAQHVLPQVVLRRPRQREDLQPVVGESRRSVQFQVQLRFGVRGQNKADVERFTKEIAPLILTGPPAVTGFAGGRPKVEEIMAYFPALIPKHLIETKVEIVEA